MFLFERLIGVGVYSALLVLVCVLIMQKNSPYRFILFLYTICLAIMGFFYVPYITADLYRINESMVMFAKYEWDSFFELYVQESSTPVAQIFYWLIGRSGELRWLPATTVFVTYSCVFYIITKTAKMYNISNKTIATAVLFIMSVGSYMSVISGIRTMLGVALLSFCFFRETILRKFNILHIPIYLIAALLHNFVLVLVMIRVVVSVFDKYMRPINKVLYICFAAILFVLSFRYMDTFIVSAFEKAESYIMGNAYSYMWEYVLGIITGLVIILLLCNFSKCDKQIKKRFFSNNLFIVACILISIIFCYEFSIFYRTISHIAPILVLPTLMLAIQKSERGPLNQSSFRMEIVVCSFIMLFLACSRGSLCSLKFFEL